MGEINLRSEKYTPKSTVGIDRFNALMGLKSQKQQLLQNLKLIMEQGEIETWKKAHHKGGLTFLDSHFKLPPLILLSGDVGCGKTELATCIANPLAVELKKIVKVFEAPSDIRGKGLVGELSGRITAAFDQVIDQVEDNEVGILIIDEADALANSRADGQQHHEDRAGVNALIKELDRIRKYQKQIAVLFITNRSKAIDPAIIRRAAIEIKFARPAEPEILEIIQFLTTGIANNGEVENLVQKCMNKEIPYTFSDLFQKVAFQSVIGAYSENRALTVNDFMKTIEQTDGSPKFIEL
jgi:SpoVK/Ycf46/Vps4 family AAA+-type ATPase